MPPTAEQNALIAEDWRISRPAEDDSATADTTCFHCGEPCTENCLLKGDKAFCCQGCLFVFDLLQDTGLGEFYTFDQHPGVSLRQGDLQRRWDWLDEPSVRERLVDFSDERQTRVTFHLPAIHCLACVWLLENLFRLNAGIGHSEVDFLRREISVQFSTSDCKLSELAALLASLGYEPRLSLESLEKPAPDPARKRHWLQIGVAGFAFGNIMLFSLPTYAGLDSFSTVSLQSAFGWISLALAAPVLAFSAGDFWRAAFAAFRRRMLTLDVPIVLGLAALYLQSAIEIVTHRGAGFLDSLAGLVFFLLCGRAFQRRAHDRMVFDRDYRSFFPLSVTKRTPAGEASTALSCVQTGDHLLIRHGEMVPADARLLSGVAFIDYSFVTGESYPVGKVPGDYLYAGGKQIGAQLEIEIVKPVSQSYLASLWRHEAFCKNPSEGLDCLTNRYSRYFTRVVIGLALTAALFWVLRGEGLRAVKAFSSVLIVACPCALALAGPFALGTAQRLLARAGVFLKNTLVLEQIAGVSTIVFDKTGTLTTPGPQEVRFQAATDLTAEECRWLKSLARNSTHPHSARLTAELERRMKTKDALPGTYAVRVEDYLEVPGRGISAVVEGHRVRLGSKKWLEEGGVLLVQAGSPVGSQASLAIDGNLRGTFIFSAATRPGVAAFLQQLSRKFRLVLLSGDNERERERFGELFGNSAQLHFNQTPGDKLGRIEELQRSGQKVMMVGDGLNDAGALKQGDVGVAVVEKAGSFSPASDVIIHASEVTRLSSVISLARRSVRLVKFSFAISAAYNVVGVSIAAAGLLSPLVCALLMPLSSVSVVLFACSATRWAARKEGFV